jgi:NRPS condensation-like uncharacterized protein
MIWELTFFKDMRQRSLICDYQWFKTLQLNQKKKKNLEAVLEKLLRSSSSSKFTLYKRSLIVFYYFHIMPENQLKVSKLCQNALD